MKSLFSMVCGLIIVAPSMHAMHEGSSGQQGSGMMPERMAMMQEKMAMMGKKAAAFSRRADQEIGRILSQVKRQTSMLKAKETELLKRMRGTLTPEKRQELKAELNAAQHEVERLDAVQKKYDGKCPLPSAGVMELKRKLSPRSAMKEGEKQN